MWLAQPFERSQRDVDWLQEIMMEEKVMEGIKNQVDDMVRQSLSYLLISYLLTLSPVLSQYSSEPLLSFLYDKR